MEQTCLIHLLGEPQVTYSGHTITTFGTVPTARLLYTLASQLSEEPSQEQGWENRDEIAHLCEFQHRFPQFQEELTQAEIADRLRTADRESLNEAVKTIRAALASFDLGTPKKLIQREGQDKIRLNPEIFTTDVVCFRKARERADDPRLSVAERKFWLTQAADKHYTGELTHHVVNDWEALNQELSDLYFQTLKELAHIYRSEGELEQAKDYWFRAYSFRPKDKAARQNFLDICRILDIEANLERGIPYAQPKPLTERERDANRQNARYRLKKAEQDTSHPSGANLTRLRQNRDKYYTALQNCQADLDLAEIGLRLAAALMHLWQSDSLPPHEGILFLREAIQQNKDRPAMELAAARNALAILLAQSGKGEQEAEPIWIELEALYRSKKENSEELAHVLSNRAQVCFQAGRIEEAEALFQESEALLRVSDTKHHLSRALEGRGMVTMEKGRRLEQSGDSEQAWQKAEQALPWLEEALLLRRSQDNQREIGITLRNIGSAHFYLKQWQPAQSYYWESLRIACELEISAHIIIAFECLIAVAGQQAGALALPQLIQASHMVQKVMDIRSRWHSTRTRKEEKELFQSDVDLLRVEWGRRNGLPSFETEQQTVQLLDCCQVAEEVLVVFAEATAAENPLSS